MRPNQLFFHNFLTEKALKIEAIQINFKHSNLTAYSMEECPKRSLIKPSTLRTVLIGKDDSLPAD
jgi:hypothetical protein